MRGTIALVTMLAAGLLVGAGPATSEVAPVAARAAELSDPIPPHPPSPLAGLPTAVFNGQVVTLADGDRYEVTHARWGRTIRGRRWDAATSAWGPLQVIFKAPGSLRCWGVLARGSGTGVAVKVECNKWGSGVTDGDGEGRPFAIVSADAQNWQSSELPGHAYRSPGISPSGTRAVWSDYEDYVTWDLASGFVRHVATPPIKFVANEAAVITDDGTVTIAYADTPCSVTFDTYSAPDAPIRQTLPTTEECDSGVVAIDAHTVAFGDQYEWGQSLLTRPDDTSPWTVANVAPLYAPGLLRDTLHPALTPVVLDAEDRPLASVSTGPIELRVQVYDPATQSWRPPATLFTRAGGTKCRRRDDPTTALGFYALFMRCAGPDRFVTSTDGGTWTTLPVRSQAIGTNRALGLVAVPDHHHTVVVGKEGSATLPVGTTGGCDIVFPIAPDRVLRLTAKGKDGWPRVLQRSTASGWRTLHRVSMPTTSGKCRRVSPGLGPELGERHHFHIDGTAWQRFARVRFVEVDGHWDVRVR